MKLAIRIFALFVVVAGAAAATSSSSTKFVSHQSAAASHARAGLRATFLARLLLLLVTSD